MLHTKGKPIWYGGNLALKKQRIALGLVLALLPGFIVGSYAAEVPSVSATSAVLMDVDSGRILYEKDADTPRSIASITKLMTALIAVECLDELSTSVTVRREWTGIEGTSLYLEPGEKIMVETLLYGLLLHSGNDAAVALACICAGDVETFVSWMNERARDLGMTNTHFSDPNGLSGENHHASAHDMARLASACLNNPKVAEIVRTKTISLEGRHFSNHNKLLWQYADCIGMKTGYTRQAGRTLVSAAERDGQRLVCVTLCDPDDWEDHKALLDYGFTVFPQTVLAEQGEQIRQIPVEGSLVRFVPAVLRTDICYPLREDETPQVQIELPEITAAPIVSGKIAGGISFSLDGKTIGEGYLVWGHGAGRDVLESSPFGFFGSLFKQAKEPYPFERENGE